MAASPVGVGGTHTHYSTTHPSYPPSAHKVHLPDSTATQTCTLHGMVVVVVVVMVMVVVVVAVAVAVVVVVRAT